MNPVLTIDPEFEAKCPPLTEDEHSQLEENILEEGLVLMPLIIWNDTIVDGHNRYRIAQAHPGIEFRTHEKQFSNRYEALSWICKNQLGRRNLTPQQKKYLIGERYDAEKKAHGGDRKSGQVKSTVQNEPLISSHMTRAQIAEDMFVSIVRKYTRARKLTPRMLNELVEKIEVYNAEKIDGEWVQRLRIHYNCVGEMNIPNEPALPIPAVTVNTRKGVFVSYTTDDRPAV